jgi:hypothetical protein
MVYEDAEKLYAEVRADTESLVDRALAVLYPNSLPLSSAVLASTSGPLTVFAHNTTAFARRDVVRVPLGERGISSGNILLQKTSDGKEGYVVLEGGAGVGLVLPSQISAKDLNGSQTPKATIMLLWLTFTRGLFRRCHGTQREQRFVCLGESGYTAYRRRRADHKSIRCAAQVRVLSFHHFARVVDKLDSCSDARLSA